MPVTLTVLLLGVAACLWAARLLVADARGGVEISFGTAMLFSNLWFAGCLAVAWASVVLAGVSAWWGLAIIAFGWWLKGRVYGAVKATWLGADVAPPAPRGLAEMERRAREER